MSQRWSFRRLWYASLKFLCWIIALVVFRIRCHGRRQAPAKGGVLVLANHQSYLDPIMVGLACDRQLNYLTRQSLFRFGPFGWLLRSLSTIPIDRDGLGLSGLKAVLRRLKQGEAVVVFPEGTRTRDGELGEMKPGFCALARRARVPILPVAIDGAFTAWPRTHRLPRPGSIVVEFATVILPHEIAQQDDGQLVVTVTRRLQSALDAARQRRHRAAGTYGPWGPSSR